MKADPFISPERERRRQTYAADEEPGPARLQLARLTARWPFNRAGRVTIHPASGFVGPGGVLSRQRAVLAGRLVGLAMLLALVIVLPEALRTGTLLTLAIVALAGGVQVVILRVDPASPVTRRAEAAIVALDLVAAWNLGAVILAEGFWVGFSGYLLVSIEAAIFFGAAGAIATAVASSAVIVAQTAWRASAGGSIEPWAVAFVVALTLFEGIYLGLYARLNQRARGDLAALLELSNLLANQASPSRIVQALDAQLRVLVSARVRSVALRRPDGGYDVLRWRSPESRAIEPEAVGLISRAAGRDLERDFLDGRAATLIIEPGRDDAVATALGVPDWVRSITLVPIHAERELTGILPVLWVDRRTPGGDELELLHGLAQQTGLAFAQAQLHRARELAATDALTGLANHRAFRDVLAAHVSEARLRGGRLAILFCDLDRFKAVNDRYGHAVGDLLLHRIAERIRAAARAEDVVARYGGDELALVLPGATAEAALDVAARIRHGIRTVEGNLGVDVTIGVARFPEDASTDEDLIARADAAMYAAKRVGGGRAMLASEIPAEA